MQELVKFVSDDWVMVYRTLILYFSSLLTIRILGKRVVGNLSPFDLLLTIIIGSAIAVPMEDESIPLMHGIIPIIIILMVNYLINLIILKNRKLEDFLQGTSTILVENGEVNLQNLRKEKISLADLLLLLREKDVTNINEVQEAVIEPNGQLSVIKKKEARSLTPEFLTELVPEIKPNYGNWLNKGLQESKIIPAKKIEKEWGIDLNLFLDAVALGFNDEEIARIMKQPAEKIINLRQNLGLTGKLGLSAIEKNQIFKQQKK